MTANTALAQRRAAKAECAVRVCDRRCKDSVRHHNVTVKDSKYTFGLASFDSLREFLEHFEKMPVVAGESGDKVLFLSLGEFC